MKKLLYITIFLIMGISGNSQTFKISYGIDPNAIFVGNKSISSKDDEIFKNPNFNTFYEINTFNLKSDKIFESFEKVIFKDKTYILKFDYTVDGNIIKTCISASDSKTLESQLLNSTYFKQPPLSSCTRYQFGSMMDCIFKWLGF